MKVEFKKIKYDIKNLVNAEILYVDFENALTV